MEDVWEAYGQVVASKRRIKVLLALYSRPKTPTQISTETDMHISHVSKVLQELVRKELVVCLTPSRKKGRVYALTEMGKMVAEIVKENVTI